MGRVFDPTSKKEELSELKKKSLSPDLWNEPDKASLLMKKINELESELAQYGDLISEIEDNISMLELCEECDDEEEYNRVKKNMKELEKKVEEYSLLQMLSGEYDSQDATVQIHAGAGGLEAQDWAEMLLRMYTRWAEHNDFKVKVMDLLNDTEGGIKSVTFIIEGRNAYGYLKGEKGVHRLVRISPFDTARKRHTSFASVDVMPNLDDDVKVEINENDLEIDTYRSSGAGGQSVNTTDSAVRIKHIPTGIVVSCQNERSQLKNKEMALKILTGKLIALAEEERKEKIDDLAGNYSKIEWGSQIRSYVFHPYQMVKDHRTEVETGDTKAVMDGDIWPFINGYLLYRMKDEN